MSARISIDHRELRSKVVSLLKNKVVDVEIINGQTADYIINKHVAIERKTIIDFLASIKDKRIFRQTKILKKIILIG
jgi:DNA excision repair protein ERCC-4